MKPISLEDVQNLQEYELARPEFRKRIIELKRRRRVPLGPLMTLLFENRETVRFQIQEMVRVERIVRPEKVREEIDVYNELLPGADQVAATLFIEVSDLAEVQPTLDRFVGLDEPGKLVLEAGDESAPAQFATGQSREDRISAVHYLRFSLGEEGRQAVIAGAPVAIRVRHAGYEADAPLSPETIAELARDLDRTT